MNFRIILLLLATVVGSFGITLFLLKDKTGTGGFELSRTFSGSQFVKEQFSDIAAPYTIDIILKSKLTKTVKKFDESNPPMPVLSGPLTIYQSGNNYSLTPKKGASVSVGPANNWNRITMAVIDQSEAKLFFNGKLVWQGSPGVGLEGITIGKGYRKRYWAGDIRRFRLMEGLLHYNEFDANKDIQRQGTSVIYELELG